MQSPYPTSDPLYRTRRTLLTATDLLKVPLAERLETLFTEERYAPVTAA